MYEILTNYVAYIKKNNYFCTKFYLAKPGYLVVIIAIKKIYNFDFKVFNSCNSYKIKIYEKQSFKTYPQLTKQHLCFSCFCLSFF